MKHIGIVVAAGKGLRAGTEIPKQYMDLCGKPVLYYSLYAMENSFIDEIILVVGEGYEEYVKKEIVEKFSFAKVSSIVCGKSERSGSVYEGLRKVSNPDDSYVYIQDGARPMLSLEILNRVKEDLECFGTSVVGVNSKDTVKIVDDDGFVATTPVRNNVWNVQTPQAFVCSDIMSAYDLFFESKDIGATDDSSVMERFGKLPVHITQGDYRNIKITTPEDFLVAENFLVKK